MMPEADIVAFSASVSNHWSRKSTADIVINWIWLYLSWPERLRKRLPRNIRSWTPFRVDFVGSGGVIARIGLTKRPMSAIALPYSSYASASSLEWRAISRRVLAWSLTRQRWSPFSIGVNVPSSGRIFEAVAREVEVPDDLGPQQRDDVRADRELEAAGEISSVTAAPPSTTPPLEHEHLLPASREVGRRGSGRCARLR